MSVWAVHIFSAKECSQLVDVLQQATQFAESISE